MATSNLATHNYEPANDQEPVDSSANIQPARDNLPESPLKRKASTDPEEDAEAKRQRTADLDVKAALDASLAKTLAFLTQPPEPQYEVAPTSTEEMAVTDEKNVYSQSHKLMRRNSMPILKSVSEELFSALVEVSYDQRIQMMTLSDSNLGQSYTAKKALFDQTKQIYCPVSEFLCSHDFGSLQPENEAIFRMADVAAFTCTVFSGKDISFFDLDSYFLKIFVPEGEVLEEDLAKVLLSLKTQIFLAAVSEEEQESDKEETLASTFPDNQGGLLLLRHPEKEVTLCESKFLTECSKRRDLLRKEVTDADSIAALSDRFSWVDFLKLFDEYIIKKYGSPRSQARAGPSSYPYLKQENAYNSSNGDKDVTNGAEKQVVDTAQRAVQAALMSIGLGSLSHDGLPHANHAMMQHYQAPGHQQNDPYGQPQYGQNNTFGSVPYPSSQSAPTQILYERARQASASKSSAHARRPGLPSQRRPWTHEEEAALMQGLDRVRGPHWSQILALYGPKGQISEILKGRNQVQLKDKARNLKLFFLKNNIEVPHYLQCVTGELKTRAPSLAQRKEAEERAKVGGTNGHYAGQYQHGSIYPLQHQQQQHQSPYQQSPYSQQIPQHAEPTQMRRNASSSSSGNNGSDGLEMLDPVGPAAKMKSETQLPAVSQPSQPSQTHAVQQAVQQMSSDEHILAIKSKAEVDNRDAPTKSSTTS